MPLIQITLSTPTPLPAAAVTALQRESTQLMQRILRKNPTLTVSSVSQLPPAAFAADGEAVASAASLLATITAGTNSVAEKAEFIAAAAGLLGACIGPTTAPIYVALQELPATDWGYDGCSQAARRAGGQS